MKLHKIAGLTVDLGYKYERMIKQAAPYKIEAEGAIVPDMTIHLSDAFLEEKQKEIGKLAIGDIEYLFTSAAFYSGLLHFGGFMLHSSAVLMDGEAFVFSADSGTGKSTHTSLWQKVYGSDRAKILNDDKPALRVAKDGIYACGTPWSGKTDLNINTYAPLAGICFLERSEKNWIKKVSGGKVIAKLLNQTIRTKNPNEMNKLLMLVDKVLTDVPVYEMGCNISEEAAIMAHDAMAKKR